MNKQPSKNLLFPLGALIGMMALGSVAGCGEGALDGTASMQYALTGQVTGSYGSTTGTVVTSGSNHLTPVTKIIGYGNGSYIYGIKLFWGTDSFMYGMDGWCDRRSIEWPRHRPGGDRKYLLTSGVLRGIKFTTFDGRNLEVGLTTATSTAFSDPDALFTDLQMWQGSVNGVSVLWGFKAYYTTP